MKAVAVAALCLGLLAGCGGDGGGTAVAHVGADAITTGQLDALVAHFRREAQREGKAFPREGTTAFRGLRDQLLGLLVYRTELEQASGRLGVKVTDAEVARRLPGGGEQEGDQQGDTFARESVEAQLRTERLFAKVTRGVESAAERNRRWAAFVARLQRETKVRYEPGYAPGS